MSNKETLQNNNERLKTNNNKLLGILQAVNELPNIIDEGTIGIEIIKEVVDFNTLNKSNISVKKDGTTGTWAGWHLYNYIYINDAETIEYNNVPAYYNVSNNLYLYGIIFYDKNFNYISGIGIDEAEETIHNQNIGGKLLSGKSNIPENAVYIRVTYTDVNNQPIIPEITLVKEQKILVSEKESENNNEKLIEKDINFFDYDGTLLHSYTSDEIQSLNSLPELPSHDGLICQGWNWSLDEIKEVNQELDIGPMYITDDGKTRLYIEIEQPSGLNVILSFYQSIASGVTIDWGDGSTSYSPSAGNVNQSHQYSNPGKYTITLDVIDSCTFYFGRNIKDSVNYVSILFGSDTSYTYPMAILKHVELGKNVQLNKGALANCYGLETITIPESITSIGLYTLYRNYALRFISFPKNINLESSQWMMDAYSLEIMSLPKNITLSENLTISGMRSLKRIPYLSDNVNEIPNYCFQTSYVFKKVVFSNVRSIGDSAFNWCQNLSILDFRRCTQVPTLGNTPFYRGPISFKILVPSALYDQWIAASGWSNYKDYIEAV